MVDEVMERVREAGIRRLFTFPDPIVEPVPEGCLEARDEVFYMGEPVPVGRIPLRKNMMVVPRGCVAPMDERKFTYQNTNGRMAESG